MLIRRASIDGTVGDCRIRAGAVEAVGALAREPGEEVVEANGGALLPGLADHHVHLLATAAASASLDLAGLADRAAVLAALRAAAEAGPVRAVGWFEERHGPLDAATLDAALPPSAPPVRVAHRSGALWVLNGAALAALPDLADPGVERGADGRPTGLLWRADHLLSALAPATPPPDLAALGRRLAGYGLTHLTDATPDLGADALALLTVGALPQRLLLLGAPTGAGGESWAAGPRKIVLADHALPDPDGLAADIAAAHAVQRAVALHCVTRAALVLALAAFEAVGAHPGDRIEHAAVAGPQEAAALAAAGVTVVTQPSLVGRRGASYRAASERADVPHLWPYASLLDAGVPVACSSDAPYGDPDPWVGVRAARDRVEESGRVLGARERVAAATALRSLLTDPRDPGGPVRRIVPGGSADLVLLAGPWAAACAEPDARHVRLTWCRGKIHEGAGGGVPVA